MLKPGHTGWWGKSEVKVYLDGDSEHATLVGNGLEDRYFEEHSDSDQLDEDWIRNAAAGDDQIATQLRAAIEEGRPHMPRRRCSHLVHPPSIDIPGRLSLPSVHAMFEGGAPSR